MLETDLEPDLPDVHEGRYAFALEAAAAAAAVTLEYFRSPSLGVEHKGDGSPVTAADKAAERLLRERIAERFPGDGVLGEEFDDTESKTGWRWIIDPIDGTFSFIKGVPLYTTLLAAERLSDAGEPVPGGVEIGVIAAPALDEVVYAARGHGAWRRVGAADPVRARVSSVASLAEATVCTTSLDYYTTPESRAVFDRVERACAHTRGWSDAYAATLLATGRCDAMVEPFMNPWDSAPMEPIIAEAGGKLTDWRGLETVHGPDLLVTNGAMHDELLRLVGQA